MLTDASGFEQCNTHQDCAQICACSAALERDVQPRVFIGSMAYTHDTVDLQFQRLVTLHSGKEMQQTLAGFLIRAREQIQPTQAMLRLTSSFQPLCDCKTCIQKSGMPDTSLSGSADIVTCEQGCWHLRVQTMQQSGMICYLLCLCAEVPYNCRHRRQPIQRIRVCIDTELES